MSKEGIYINLWKEFQREIEAPYSILPLVRLSQSNSEREAALRESSAKGIILYIILL